MITIHPFGVGKYNLSFLTIAIRRAIPSLIVVSLPVCADITIPSQTSTYVLSGTEPFVMPAPNTITVTDGTGIAGDASQNWLITIDDGASVEGFRVGVDINSATNNGSILNLNGDITSTGTGSGGNAGGVRLLNGGTVNIGSTGSINSASDGIYLSAGGTVNNSGFIRGADTGTSVYFSNGGNYTGGGTIGGGYGIIVDAGTSNINNTGAIGVSHTGVWYRGSGSGTFTNQAGSTLSSDSTSLYALDISSSGTVSITNAGAITGAGTAILMTTAGHSLLNSGEITGEGGTAISLSGSNNALTLTSGSDINGAIVSTGSGNSLTLTGQGTLDSAVTGINAITGAADVGGSWTLNGATLTTKATTAQALLVQSGTLILNGALTHEGAGGGTTINPDAVLQLGNNSDSGSVTGDITDNGLLRFSRTDAATFAGVISGAGSVEQAGSGTTILSNANTYSGGTTVSSGTLNASNVDGLGSGSIAILGSGTLDLSFFGDIFANDISNDGLLDVIEADNTLSGDMTGAGINRISALNTGISGDNTGFTGRWEITSPGSANVQLPQALGSAPVLLSGILNIVPVTGGFSFANALTGAGQLTVAVTAGNAFDFTSAVGNAFTGQVILGPSLFALSGANTSTLANATLQSNIGNQTTVGAGTQNVGNLNINGGTLIFSSLPTGTISTGQLGINSGIVRIDPQAVVSSGGGLLTQDDGSNVQLIAATGVSGEADNLTLTDLNGVALTDLQENIDQGGNTVAIGTYGYSLNNTGGLRVGYTLSQLDLQAGQTLTLSGDSATPGGASDMKALLTGSGNLAVNATDAITLTNGSNTFSGTTTVSGGTLRAGANDVINDSSQVTLNTGTTFDLNGFDQSVNNLNGTGNVTLGTGDLVVTTPTGAVTYGGVISGDGAVTTAGPGTWILTGNNLWTGGTTLGAGTLQLGAGGTSGAIVGNITNNAALVVNRADDLTLSGAIGGTGSLTQNSSATGTTTLAGDNSYTGATTVQQGTLQLGNGGTTGALADASAVTINSGATLAVDRSNALAVGSTIDGAGQVIQRGGGITTLSGNNSYSGGTTVASGTLNASGATALGTGAATVDSGAALLLSFSNGVFANGIANAGLLDITGSGNVLNSAISGAGTNRISAANTTIGGDNTLFTGTWDITSGGAATVNAGQNLSDAAVQLDGILNITPSSGAYTFTNTLTGAGRMTVALDAASSFAFDNIVGSAWTGTLQLGQSQFALAGGNTTALTNATLQLDASSETTVGAGTQAIGNLNLNGGTLSFANLPTGTITTGQLALNGGTVQIDPQAVVTNGGPLLTQDEGANQQLVTASGVSGSAGNLTLTDLNGDALSSAQENIVQGGNTVAIGTYGYSLNNSGGLGVAYTLSQLDLQAGQTLTLSGDSVVPASAADMKALLAGSGNLAVDATNAITLTNGGNNFTGTTTVTGGTLRAGAENVIDDSTQLTLNDGTTFDLNGFNQSVNNLTGTGNVTLGASDLLAITPSATVTYGGVIDGSGAVTKAGAGTWILTGNNTWSGGTLIDAGVLQLGASGTSGSLAGDVTNNAALVVNRSDDVTLCGVISGSGIFTQNSSGTGTTTLTGNNTWTGATAVQQGTLQLGSGGTSGSLASASGITINSGATLAFNRSNLLTVGNTLTGAGDVEQRGSGTTVLSGASDYSGGTTVASGTLDAANASALGTGAATVNGGATLGFSFSSGTFANAIANAGLLNVTGANNTLNSAITGTGENRIGATGTTLGGDNSGFTGSWNVLSGASTNVSAAQNLGSASVLLDGLMNIAPASGGYTFTNALTGAGEMAVALVAGNTFAFASSAGTAFLGTLGLGQSQFALSGDNTAALTGATLRLDAGSETTVGAGTQTIGSLNLNGGALIFNGEVPPGQPDGLVKVTNLTLNSGQVRVEAPTAGVPNPAPSGQNLMEEDDEAILSQLVAASGTVTGSAGNLTLADHAGNAITNPQQFAVTESGTAVANATYDYSLSTGTGNNGLYIQYGLTALDLIDGQTLHLTADTGATGAAATLSAQVTGSGNLEVNASPAGAQTVALNNSRNNFTGATTVSGGTLRLDSSQALGNTRLLTINSGANTDINGMTQTVGALGGTGGLAINGGNLTVSSGGIFGGVASGTSGALNLTGGTLLLTGANTFSGTTTINSGATLQVGAGGTSGSFTGPVTDNGVLAYNRSDDVALAGGVTGSGELHQDGAGTLFVNSDVQVTGPVVINAGTLSIGDGTTDGSVTSDIINNSALVFNRSSWSYGGEISGAGTVEQRSSGVTTLSGTSSYSGATTVSAGTLNAASAQALGSSATTVNSGATLALSFNDAAFGNGLTNNGVVDVTGAGNTLNSAITGGGLNRISALNTRLAGDNSGFTGSWDIINTGEATITSAQNLGAGPVQLSGRLNVTPDSGGYTFSNALTGSGVLAATMGTITDAFNFAASAGNAFTGALSLAQGSLELEGDNVNALTNATLALGSNAVATLTSDQTIGNLRFDGGKLDVAMTSPSSANVLTVGNLDVDSPQAPAGVGVVNLQAASLPPSSKPDGNFLDQDNTVDNGIQIVSATTISSIGKQLTLLMDNAAPADETDRVTDGFGHDDVLATYGYTAVTAQGVSAPAGPGLYAGYMLKVLNSQSGAVLDTTGAADTTLGAQLTGVGDFEFRAHDGTLTLLNGTNDYQGRTLVTSGTLLLGDDGVLGQTRDLTIATGATTDLNGHSQSIGELNGAAGSTLALNGGALTLTNGGQSDGNLTGAGNLLLDGGALTISNANSALTANVAIGPDATARLNNTGGLGSGNVALEGTLAFVGAVGTFANSLQGAGAVDLENSSDVTLTGNNLDYRGTIDIGEASRLTALQPSGIGAASIVNDGELVLNTGDVWAFNNAMSGSGLLTKAGSGTVTLAGDYGHTGGTHVDAGTLALDNSAAALSGGGPVTVDEGATLGGYGTITGNVTNQGTLSAGDAITTLTGGAGNLTIQGNLDNFNTVNLAGNTVGNTLTVTGNYTAHSALVLNTVLGGDDSQTDKLIVQGNTSGNTDVYVNNRGGSGAQTVNGIRIIEVGGASDGNFALANRVVAGAYDYQLLQGTPTVNDGDWYLRVPTPTPDVPVVPVRPEAGAYLANQSAAINMFSHSLHDRLGESLFVTGNGQQEEAPSAWIRVFGSRTDSQSAGQIGQDTWSNGLQLGFDLANNLQVQNRWQVGVMAGYGSARTRNITEGQSYVARSTVDGYSVGVYGTWYADGRPNGTGPYIDSWAQYGWFNNKVSGEDLPQEEYDSRTQSVSLEGGWAFNVYNTAQMDFFLQPQNQVIYTRYDADDVKEENGTRVKSRNDGGFSNRLGVRAYGYSSDKQGRQWQPFVEVNWLYSDYQDSIAMDNTRLSSDTPKHRYEVKTGLEAKLTNRWNIWGNIGTQQGWQRLSQHRRGIRGEIHLVARRE